MGRWWPAAGALLAGMLRCAGAPWRPGCTTIQPCMLLPAALRLASTLYPSLHCCGLPCTPAADKSIFDFLKLSEQEQQARLEQLRQQELLLRKE